MKPIAEFWWMLQIDAPEQVQDVVAALLPNCLGVIQEEDTARYYLPADNRESAETSLATLTTGWSMNWQKVFPEPWHLAWKDNFTPVNVRDRILIVPDWDQTSSAEILIRIRPGMAFGTGHHATTWLMLSMLMGLLNSGEKVLDVGAGSGVLALAAHRLGASFVQCLEYDPVCQPNFEENLELNGITEGIAYHITDARTWTDWSCDLVLANVNRRVIMDLIPLWKGCRAPIVISGLLQTDEADIQQLCERHGFEILQRSTREEWLCLVVQKKNKPGPGAHPGGFQCNRYEDDR